jgi:hypothetical protein
MHSVSLFRCRQERAETTRKEASSMEAMQSGLKQVKIEGENCISLMCRIAGNFAGMHLQLRKIKSWQLASEPSQQGMLQEQGKEEHNKLCRTGKKRGLRVRERLCKEAWEGTAKCMRIKFVLHSCIAGARCKEGKLHEARQDVTENARKAQKRLEEPPPSAHTPYTLCTQTGKALTIKGETKLMF